jgi:hypothetical protein
MRWATRPNCHVDRGACAWLIKRHLDPAPEFIFVEDVELVPEDATAFDMRGVELSHHGGCCSFETMLRHYGFEDPVMWDIAKVVHEVDLQDGRYDAPDAPGLDAVLRGLSLLYDDEAFLELAATLFDAYYAHRKPIVELEKSVK